MNTERRKLISERVLCKVTFVNYDGAMLKTEVVTKGGTATPPAAPTRKPTAEYTYTFSGWDKNYYNITGDMIITAVYVTTVREYLVSFASYDGSTIYTSALCAVGTPVVTPALPTRESEETNTEKRIYTFSGWATTKNAASGTTDTIIAEAKPVTYYAAYSVQTEYKFTFMSYDGSSTYSSNFYAPGVTITPPSAPTRATNTVDGEERTYTFSGWATTKNAASGATGTIIAETESVTYYAAFSAVCKQYLIQNGKIMVNKTSAVVDGSLTFSTTDGQLKISGTMQRVAIVRFSCVNVGNYTSIAFNGKFSGTNPYWGLGTQSTDIASESSGGVKNYITRYSNLTKEVDISTVTNRNSATCVYLEFDTHSTNLISDLYLSRTIG